MLSADKQYLVESRLLPVARKAGLGGLAELVAALKLADAEALMTAVVEAMMTNETFFFRDKTPFEHFRATDHAGAAGGAARARAPSASGARRPRPARSLIRSPCASRRWSTRSTAGTSRLFATDLSNEVLEKARHGVYSQFEVQRGLPIQLLIKYFAKVGELWQIAPDIRAMVKYQQLNLLSPISPISAASI